MPVHGGDKLRRVIAEKRRAVRNMPRGVQVGIFGDAAIDMLVNEFGLPSANPPIPARPAFRNAIRAALDDMHRETVKRATAHGGAVTRADAKAIGTILAKRLEAEINAIGPPNKPWKGPGGTPLVLTGRLLKSIGVEIIE